jgi:predicted MFS family arabinose efflux permease
VSDRPLYRNRDFVLLQTGQFLSNVGTASTSIAYPLLVLALTHSAAKAGIVASARAVPAAVFMIPAGVAADRFSRKRLMIAADVVRVLSIGALAAMILRRDVVFWTIPVVAFVEGIGASLFSAAQVGAVRAVVPPRLLPSAASAQTGRLAAVDLAGPPLGGALFAIGRAIPFLFDSVSYVFSTLSIAAMRTPFQSERSRERSPLRERLAEGFRFLWSRPFLRTCALLFSLGNFLGPGLVLALVVIGRREGLSSVTIGALTASLGCSVLVGSLASGAFRRAFGPRTILLLELWTGAAFAVFLVRPSVFVLAAGMLPTSFVIPSTNAIVHGYRIAMTPDRLLGRSESVRSTISLAVAPLGPLLAGWLLAVTSPRKTIAVFVFVALVLALWGTLSPSIRDAPTLDELERLANEAS